MLNYKIQITNLYFNIFECMEYRKKLAPPVLNLESLQGKHVSKRKPNIRSIA